MKSHNYKYRFYRKWTTTSDLNSFRVHCYETDLQVYAKTNLTDVNLSDKTQTFTKKYRKQIEETIQRFPQFLNALHPIKLKSKYKIINTMISRSSIAGVGPMAGVAGALAEFIGMELLPYTEELIIENGGDIFIKSIKDRIILVYAGEDSPFKDRIRIKLRGRDRPFGICTSSKRIGHSLSLGNTDATIIIAQSTITADVFATAVGNLVKTADDMEKALEFAGKCNEIDGGIILIGEKIAAWGDIEFV